MKPRASVQEEAFESYSLLMWEELFETWYISCLKVIDLALFPAFRPD
jgi:hypothetical protein